jgi:hypothetical protein
MYKIAFLIAPFLLHSFVTASSNVLYARDLFSRDSFEDCIQLGEIVCGGTCISASLTCCNEDNDAGAYCASDQTCYAGTDGNFHCCATGEDCSDGGSSGGSGSGSGSGGGSGTGNGSGGSETDLAALTSSLAAFSSSYGAATSSYYAQATATGSSGGAEATSAIGQSPTTASKPMQTAAAVNGKLMNSQLGAGVIIVAGFLWA